MVLSLALTEGTADDRLAIALVDGCDVQKCVGVAGFRPVRDGDDRGTVGGAGPA